MAASTDLMNNRWQSGVSYGPVLSQTDLYLLKTELTIHPILSISHPTFHLVFNVQTGQTGGYNPSNRDRDLPFSQKDEPATLPRVQQLIIISEHSPWCTIVKNEKGVTLGDVCQQIWKDYTDNLVTEAELAALPTRMQEQIRRHASHAATSGWGYPYQSPAPTAPVRYRRVDWLRERLYFEGLVKRDDYVVKRLGYKAPNIFVMNVIS